MPTTHRDLNPEHTLMEHSCRLARPVFIYLEKEHGKEAFRTIAERAGLPVDYLMDEHNWMSHQFYKRFLEELVRYTGDPKSPFKAGLHAATPEGYGHLYWLLRAFGSTALIIQQCVRLVPKYTKVASYTIRELTRNKVVLELKHNPGYQQSELACLDAMGEWASIPMVQGAPPGRIVEHQCQAHGADCCVYEMRWINRPGGLPRLVGLLGAVALVIIDHATFDLLSPLDFGVIGALPALLTLALGYVGGALVEVRRSDRFNALLAQELDRSLFESMEVVERKFEDLRRARDEIVGLKNDELRAKHQELAAVNAQLLKALEDLQRLDSKKTEFLRIVAHDLKTPLASICIYARMLATYDDLSTEEQRSFLEIMDKESLRLAGIVDRFLDLTRIESGTLHMIRSRVRLGELLQHIGQVFQAVAEGQKVTLVYDIDPDIPIISADEGRLSQVVSNLIANACRFSPAEGQVTIRAALVEGDGPAEVLISVADKGPGVPAAAGAAIYDKFFHADDEAGRGPTGQGLGLFIANEIVKAHGGRLYHESTEGHGATFFVRLPVEATTLGEGFR